MKLRIIKKFAIDSAISNKILQRLVVIETTRRLGSNFFVFINLKSIPQSLAFMTGEFNTGDLAEINESLFGRNEFYLLIILMAMMFIGHLVIMNVFTGLAVGDVAKIQVCFTFKNTIVLKLIPTLSGEIRESLLV